MLSDFGAVSGRAPLTSVGRGSEDAKVKDTVEIALAIADALPEDARDAAGFGLKRNPGAVGVWITKSFRTFKPHHGNSGVLFRIGDPEQVLWFANGREATREEVQHSVDTGLPMLWELAELDGAEGKQYLQQSINEFSALLP